MKSLNRIPVIAHVSDKTPPIFVSFALSLCLFGCASTPGEADIDRDIYQKSFSSVADPTKPKSIFVFMDGTGNNPSIPTNIYRIFEEVNHNNDNQTVADYIEGVGNAKDPLLGQAAGFGMEERILLGYAFITKHYQPKDHIYLFGFSRGAHTARSLAGLIAYAGIPKISDDERDNKDALQKIGNKILELTKDVQDNDYYDAWQNWNRGDKPLLAELILDKKINGKKGRETQPAEVDFLGVFDTVPGSLALYNEYFGDDYISCKEKLDWNKTWPIIKDIFYYGSLTFMARGERYKNDSYPPIRYIAHAVSKDEKRSMFMPLFLCSKTISRDSVMNPRYTALNEALFPGAHADVGGGYEDLNHELPDLSLNWMFSLLREHYQFPASPPASEPTNAQPAGLAHLSISDSGGSRGSECRDRKFLNSFYKDQSILLREQAGPVPVAVFGQAIGNSNSAQSCSQRSYSKELKQENIVCVEQKNINCEYITQQKWTSKN
jgi:hypothetical protein